MDSQAETDASFDEEDYDEETSEAEENGSDSEEDIDAEDAAAMHAAVRNLNGVLNRIRMKSEHRRPPAWLPEAIALWLSMNKLDSDVLPIIQAHEAAKVRMSMNKQK